MSENKKWDPDSWKIISSDTIYKFPPHLHLEKQLVQLPDGRLVDDYHTLKMPDYSVTCPFTSEGKILILRGYRHGVGDITSFLPGGMIETNETPLTAAKRELVEETGYQAEVWTSMGTFVPHLNYGCGRVHLFRAVDVQQACQPDKGDLEEMKTEIITVEKAEEWLRSGQIRSLAAAAAIALGLAEVF